MEAPASLKNMSVFLLLDLSYIMCLYMIVSTHNCTQEGRKRGFESLEQEQQV